MTAIWTIVFKSTKTLDYILLLVDYLQFVISITYNDVLRYQLHHKTYGICNISVLFQRLNQKGFWPLGFIKDMDTLLTLEDRYSHPLGHFFQAKRIYIAVYLGICIFGICVVLFLNNHIYKTCECFVV